MSFRCLFKGCSVIPFLDTNTGESGEICIYCGKKAGGDGK